MTTIDTRADLDRLELTVEASYPHPVERVWQLWADPRKLERWWGPPSHPATVVDHVLHPGGHVSYYMTGPEGDQYKGHWQVLEVEEPTRLLVEDAFADEDGQPNPDMPMSTMEVSLADTDDGTRMVVTSRYPSREAMQQVLDMGVEEGLRQAMGQIDEILAEDA